MSTNCIDMSLIDVTGLCDPEGINLDANPFWTQIFIPETLEVPTQKPDIEQINAVNVKVTILRQKIVVTPTSVIHNAEGKFVTGKKLIIEGCITQTVNYTADVGDQSVHSAHFSVPFSAYIVIPGTTPENAQFRIVTCVEDLFIKNFTKRNIFKNVTLLLQAIPLS